MKPLKILSASEQMAAYLKEEILQGTWVGIMPGENQLSTLLGGGAKTIKLALSQLEKEGILINQGAGKRRLIALSKKIHNSKLRIAILDYDPPAKNDRIQLELMSLLKQRGHSPFFTTKTLTELQMNIGRIARLVKKTDADAWIVCAAPREINEWFSK